MQKSYAIAEIKNLIDKGDKLLPKENIALNHVIALELFDDLETIFKLYLKHDQDHVAEISNLKAKLAVKTEEVLDVKSKLEASFNIQLEQDAELQKLEKQSVLPKELTITHKISLSEDDKHTLVGLAYFNGNGSGLNLTGALTGLGDKIKKALNIGYR